MGRILKPFLYFVVALVGLLLVAGISVMLLFDPNDYRDDIELAVQKSTGRELDIEGELSISIFPWLAIEIGPTRLGNAAGFGAEPFASFERARLSVRLLPMLLRRDVEVATADLESLRLNLAVDSKGRSNWQDLVDASNAAAAAPAESGGSGEVGGLDIAGFEIRNSAISYNDAAAGGKYQLDELNIATGSVSSSNGTIHIDGIEINALLSGVATEPTTFALETAAIDINTETETIAMDEVGLGLLGLDISAAVEPFSYAGDITPVAAIQVDAFSLRSLMQRMGIEAPETTDPAALGKVIIDATARVTPTAIGLTDLTLVLDETTFTGELSVPQGANDLYTFSFKGDAIDLDRYMAPASEAAGDATDEAVPVEIPADLIRLVNSRGSLTIGRAQLSGMQFENITLGLTTSNGDLRLHPVSATLFDGKHNGDVRINASGETPVISVNERVEGVQLAALAKAMFDQDNITGTINGSFKLSGRGKDLAAIQGDLDGNIDLELLDGAWEGTDIWYELRRARAVLRQEAPPQPTLPARTRFSEVSASGPVTDGVFSNSDLLAELPFMRVTGNGVVNFVAASVDYRMSASVLEKPELMGADVGADELKDFTRVVIPLRISGSLAAPTIAPDLEKMLKEQAKKEVEEKLEDKLKDRLGDLLKR
ncbi:MAG: AsmA family protein [Gammaproteobacteria bacterium]|nr:AsmA family protein [Gammaproteobacteria bacterium]